MRLPEGAAESGITPISGKIWSRKPDQPTPTGFAPAARRKPRVSADSRTN
jgi:hypothetical protein